MKTLIYGTGYFYDDACVELCKLWARLVRKLDPGADVILIDAASPFDPREFLNDNSIEIFRFEDNIGHLARGGKDGAGRSFIKGLELASERRYHYAVHYEADVLFAHSCEQVIRERMHDGGELVLAMPLKQYDFPGFELSFWPMSWVNGFDFIARYDWENAPRFPIPEIRLKQLAGNDLFLLPFTGMRNDQGYLTSANLANNFPYGPPDWLTRIVHPDLAYRFLQLNKIEL